MKEYNRRMKLLRDREKLAKVNQRKLDFSAPSRPLSFLLGLEPVDSARYRYERFREEMASIWDGWEVNRAPTGTTIRWNPQITVPIRPSILGREVTHVIYREEISPLARAT